ncbi:leucine-rich repeat domain-containing protein [Rheinheimera sp.]|uniref:leucine-rich repeat domain-containing protein n=1 Tax=Rheinheimera sp. TaxID=1869214 RepID=UPI003D287DE9
MQYQRILALGWLISLSGCGGGGGDSSAPVTPEVPQYLVSTQASAGGSLSPASTQVRQGAAATFTVSPATGHEIDSVSGCAGSLTGNQYTTGAVNAACTVTASFKKQNFLLTAKAGTGGTITPAEQRLAYGDKAEWAVKAQTGYQIDQVAGCNGSLNGDIYSVATVTAVCEVNASFKKLSYTVSAAANAGGTVTPASQKVEHGNTTTVTVKPTTGFAINTATGCNGQLQGEVYRTGAITADCKVDAVFGPAMIQVTTTTSSGGKLNQSNPQVKYGESLQLTLLPDPGFDITTATGCGGKLQGAVFTTAPVTAACTVEAKFNDNTIVVFPDAGLDKTVRQQLGIDESTAITKLQLAQLTKLVVSAGQVVDLQGLQYATGLTNLRIQNNKVVDISPLQYLTKLQELYLGYNPITSFQPLSPLKNLRLLWLFDTPAQDLSPLRGLQLRELGLSNKAVLDLGPLQGMPLEYFYLWFSATTDLSPLAAAPLRYLDVQYSKVQDLSVLKNLANLWGTNLSGTEVTDLSALRQVTRLTSLSLKSSRIQNLDMLNDLALAQSATLEISGCIDQTGYSRHLEQLKALQTRLGLNLVLGSEKRNDCVDTLTGTNLSVQAQVVDRTLQYSWQISGNTSPVHCALYLDQDDQLPGTAASALQACAATGTATYSGHQADQFRPAIWFDNGIGGEKLIKLAEVGTAPAQPALQSLDLSQITISTKPLLVAERDGLLRLHVTAAQSPALLPKFQLDLQLNGSNQLLDAAAPKKLPASKVHRSLTDAYQAIIPANWMKPGLQIKVLQDGQLVRTYAPQFAPARPLAIRIVPFQLGDQVATLPDVNAVKNAVRTYWPFSQIDVRTRAPYQLKAGGTKSSAYVMLPELADLRRIEGEGVYYYGYFKPEMGDNCCGGLGYIGAPIAVGYDSDNGEILAHELGHNFGRQHVGCGNPSGPDDGYPYPVNSMGSVGLDLTLTGWMSPADHKDLMSYCGPKHVSDYSVAAVQDFVQTNPPAAFPTPAQAVVQAQTSSSALYLAGTLQGSSVQVRTLVPLSRAPRSEAASGYSIRVLNEQGSWFEFNLQLLQVDHPTDPSERHFSVELPQMTIQRFEIWHSGVLLAVQENSAVVAGSASQKQYQQQQSQSHFQLDESANQLCVSWPAGKDATLSVIHQQNGEDTVLALNETAGQFCRDSSALPAGGDWRLIWRQQLSVQEFRQAR